MAEVWRFFAHEDDFADIDEAGACERLGRVLSFPTISSMDAEAVDWQPFDDLRAYMQQAWPYVFAAGEVLDIDGDCGGFNLQWAWSSGYIAAQNASCS